MPQLMLNPANGNVDVATHLETPQLTLIPATGNHVRAELNGHCAIGDMLGAVVPESWPPGQYDRDAQEYFLRALDTAGEDGVGWYGWYAVRKPTAVNAATLVGSGGYLGPPTNGTVEIGYSVCPEFRGNGFATEIAGALARHALALPQVTRVVAHTDAVNAASIAVLVASGFVQAAISDEPGALLFEWPFKK